MKYGLFPAAFIGAMLAALAGLRAGIDEAVLLAAVSGSAALIVAVFERISPHYTQWNESLNDVRTDAAHAAVSMVTVPRLIEIGLRSLLLAFATQLAFVGTLWPHEWPLPAQLGLALLVSQFGEYWAHRAGHEIPLLWRLHATHHSPGRLYWLNAARFHPLDATIGYTVAMTPMLLLGVGPEVLLLLSVWIAVHGLFQHCNIELRLGPLNYIFSMAELHRWHHSTKIDEANANYGNNIIFWDIVFGTMFWPKDRQAAAQVGLADMPEFPQDYAGQLLSPFRWPFQR